jgi:hypothetical protein
MAGRGNRGGRQPTTPGSSGNLLNLERVPNLAPKFANKLGKTAAGYAVIYSGSGIQVIVQTMVSENGTVLAVPENGEYPKIPLLEFERRVALLNQPTEADRITALRRKFELRLEREFPANGPASGSEADVQAWLAGRPFEERLVLLKSQKDFEKSKAAVPAVPPIGGFRAN